MSGRHGLQYVAQCVACAALTLVVWQKDTNLSLSSCEGKHEGYQNFDTTAVRQGEKKDEPCVEGLSQPGTAEKREREQERER